jgi:hypothetical protein
VTIAPGAADGILTITLCSEPFAPIRSSRFVTSAADPLTVTAETSAPGLIRNDKVEAGEDETFLTLIVALTVRVLSASAAGTVALMSYFWTCHVAVARVSSCAAANAARNVMNNKKSSGRVSVIYACVASVSETIECISISLANNLSSLLSGS